MASSPETTMKALSILAFREGGGLAFVQEGETVSVLKIEGTEAPTDTLARLGTCRVEHAAWVAGEISEGTRHE